MLPRRTFLLAAAASAASASEAPISAAVYGLGHAHAAGKVRTLQSLPEYSLVGLCEPERPDLFAKPDFAGLPRLTARQMLDDPAIELIAVEADVQHGLAYAHQAVDAGKFVHLDKPPGQDLASLRDLFDKAAARGRIVQMGYMWRYHIAMSDAIRRARSGELGQIYGIKATINKPITPQERHELAAFRGGMMFELGCHLLDRVVDVLGKPYSVRGILRHDADAGDGLADNTLAILEYDRALAEVYIAAMQPNGNAYRTFQILGTAGTATVQPFSPDGRLELDLGDGPRKVPLHVPADRGRYDEDFREMARVIRHGEKPSYSAEHDLTVQETLLRACDMAG
ncbi:MAG: gfo/Idh/MocA family oxidoreductase [Acidobacteria bacterium]|nr:gfo/Idh/MocA family oxidoreductase [Acidobacteriota bacterium]